jgi:hypothetical protein
MTASAQTPPVFGLPFVRLSACDGKQAFHTMTQAQKIAAKSRRQGGRGMRRAYRCKVCGMFHIGASILPKSKRSDRT